MLIILLLLPFGGGGGYYGYSSEYYGGGGFSIVGIVLMCSGLGGQLLPTFIRLLARAW